MLAAVQWLWRGLILTSVIAVALGGYTQQVQQTEQAFPVAALSEDLRFLEAKLLKVHPAPYMYASPEQFRHCFDSLRTSIRCPLTQLQFLSTIAATSPLLGDGHTMFLPSASTESSTPKRFLPLNVYSSEGRLYIRSNGTTDQRLRPGAEILAINGVSAVALMDTLMRRQIRDGYNTTYPTWILNKWFKEYYRFSVGEVEVFTVTLRSGSSTEDLRVEALESKAIDRNIAAQTVAQGETATTDNGIRLGFLHDTIAMLTVPSFDASALKAEYGQDGERAMRSAFARLNSQGTDHLILDLRGNQGGDPSLGKLLLSYLLHEPFELVHRGPASGTRQPQGERFAGQLIVLMDGGCFSVTGMVLSCLERHKRATFVGEEAGGNRTVLAGNARSFKLPNTGIQCYISTRLWQLVDRPNDGHGVRPTHQVRPTIEDLVSGRDPFMERALHALRMP